MPGSRGAVCSKQTTKICLTKVSRKEKKDVIIKEEIMRLESHWTEFPCESN